MKVQLGSIYKTKDELDSEYIICPIENYDRNKYLNKRLFIRTFFWCLFAFGLGYNLYWYNHSLNTIIDIIFKFIYIYIGSFYLMQLPHELIHLLFYPKTFTEKNIDIKFLNHKRLVTCISHSPISSQRLCFILILPFILFVVMPSTLCILNGYFNIYIYGFTAANAILSADDLLNVFLQFFKIVDNEDKFLYELLNVNELSTSKEDLNVETNIITTKNEIEN